MSDLLICFTKARESTAQDVLTCVRRDGSRTWSKLHAAFPVHDMTHFATESVLGARDGFFGLLAQGWDIGDFAMAEKRATMPLQALWVEHVVGIIWGEYVASAAGSYEEFSAAIAGSVKALREGIERNAMRRGPRPRYAAEELSLLGRGVSERERALIMGQIGELTARWALTPRGGVMELPFDLSAAHSLPGASSAVLSG